MYVVITESVGKRLKYTINTYCCAIYYRNVTECAFISKNLRKTPRLKEEPALVATQGSPSQIGASLVNMTNGPVESKSHEGARLSVEVIGWCLITGGF